MLLPQLALCEACLPCWHVLGEDYSTNASPLGVLLLGRKVGSSPVLALAATFIFNNPVLDLALRTDDF